jgi:hypothetical protein
MSGKGSAQLRTSKPRNLPRKHWQHSPEVTGKNLIKFEGQIRRRIRIMASQNAFTEEGRTRLRNFQRRVSSYFRVWILVGIAVTIGACYLRTRYGYRPLQRLYLKQYLRASIKSFLPLKKPSKYTVLVRVIPDPRTGKELVFGCTDDQVTPIRDETGRVKFDPKLGPFFELQPGIPHKYFYWRSWRIGKNRLFLVRQSWFWLSVG